MSNGNSRCALAFVFERQTKFSVSVLAGVVEADDRFEHIDMRLLRPSEGLAERIGALCRDHDRVVVGYSFTTPQALQVLEAVQAVRATLTAPEAAKVTLVAGGPHPSGDWRQTLGMGFDVVVVGEGEHTFPQLLEALYGGADLSGIRGLAYEQDGEVAYTGRAEPVACLDDYPPFAEKFGLFSSIEITRGCPWACRFCQASSLFGPRMRHRSVEGIARWAEASARQDLCEIRFVTPDSFAYGSDGRLLRLDLLAEMLRAVNEVVGREHTYLGSFPSEVRPETVSPEAVELVREHAANDNIIIGAQSGSQRMLDLSHRGHTVEDTYRAVQITLATGLVANVDFIFGMPGETSADREQTAKVIEDLASMGARIHSHAFVPLAGTAWAGARPGRVDRQTRDLLQRLTGSHQQYGQWRKQQEAGRSIVRFREMCLETRCGL